MAKQESWGGKRSGAGRKATWKSGTCKAVKIPALLVDEVVRYARQLDEGGPVLIKKQIQETDSDRIPQLEFRLEQARADLHAVKEETRKAHNLRMREWGRTCEGASILTNALDADNKRSIPRSTVEGALDVITPGWRKEARPSMSKAPAPSTAKEAQWEQLSNLVDEKQELSKQLQHVRDTLAQERRARELRDREFERLKAQLKDARSILSDALLEHQKGIRKGVRIRDVESALLALHTTDLD